MYQCIVDVKQLFMLLLMFLVSWCYCKVVAVVVVAAVVVVVVVIVVIKLYLIFQTLHLPRYTTLHPQ